MENLRSNIQRNLFFLSWELNAVRSFIISDSGNTTEARQVSPQWQSAGAQHCLWSVLCFTLLRGIKKKHLNDFRRKFTTWQGQQCPWSGLRLWLQPQSMPFHPFIHLVPDTPAFSLFIHGRQILPASGPLHMLFLFSASFSLQCICVTWLIPTHSSSFTLNRALLVRPSTIPYFKRGLVMFSQSILHFPSKHLPKLHYVFMSVVI